MFSASRGKSKRRDENNWAQSSQTKVEGSKINLEVNRRSKVCKNNSVKAQSKDEVSKDLMFFQSSPRVAFRAIVSSLGEIMGSLGMVLGALGTILGGSWECLGLILQSCWSTFGN